MAAKPRRTPRRSKDTASNENTSGQPTDSTSEPNPEFNNESNNEDPMNHAPSESSQPVTAALPEIHDEPRQSPAAGAQMESLAGNTELTLTISKSLRKRLEHSAREEGVSVDDLISELLAEGVVLRAWEIVERKSAMRGGSQNQQQHQHQHQQRQGNNRHGGGNKQGNNKHGGGRMNKRHAAHATSLNLMEDKAAFLEYVRNQERKNHNR